MVITAANVGDVIRMDHKSRCILIENVTDKFVHYRQESGDRYATTEREIEGTVVRDPARVSAFQRNAKLGAALAHAEFSALRKGLDSSADPAQREEAGAVLGIVKSMQKGLESRILGFQDKEDRNHRASLDDMIRNANSGRGHSVTQDRKVVPAKDNSHGR